MQYCLRGYFLKSRMNRILKGCLKLYTVLIGLLIPGVFLLKAISYAPDYWPVSTILFLLLLLLIFASCTWVLALRKSGNNLKRVLYITALISVASFFILQLVGAVSLFKEKISSAADIATAFLYMLLIVLGLASVVFLFRETRKKNRQYFDQAAGKNII